ncbi:MAG: hypothetical protein NWE93_05875 [Candidatus Bathyarchaeota archaeon]|nr:hypothetical protein [Candidatus Bathyarchaeota archaeon]
MNEIFGEEVGEFRNRAVIVSAYLFVEQLIEKGKVNQLPAFKTFYIRFLDKLSYEAARGLDYHPEYHELLDFQTNILQAAVGRAAIEARHKIITEYFDYFIRSHGEIKTTKKL